MTMIPFTAYPSDIDDGDASWNVQSTLSPKRPARPQNVNNKRNISIVKQLPDLLASSQALLNSPPRISKQEFVERWLQAHNIVDAFREKSQSPSSSSSSSASVIPNTPPSKRPLRSPLKDSNQLKRFKEHEATAQSIQLTCDSTKSKENHTKVLSNINNNADLISEATSSNFISRSKLDVCKSAIFGVPERSKDMPAARSQVNQAIYDGSQLKKIPKIEPASNIHFESPKKTEIISVASSSPAKSGIQICDDDSSNDDVAPKIEIIDSDSDRTASDIIEDPDRIVYQERNTTLVDNDFTNTKTPVCQNPPGNLERHLSHEIEEVSSQDVKGSGEEGDNPGRRPAPMPIPPPITSFVPYFQPKRRRRKRKIGSQAARLFKLISRKRSEVRIWRHYLNKREPETSRKEYFVLKITDTICMSERHCFVGIVASDLYNLFEKFLKENDITSDKILGTSVIAMTDSQLVASDDMEEANFVRIYPPWEILHADKFILNAVYFTLHCDENPCDITEVPPEEDYQLLQEFNCPCINAKGISNSCRVKFREKPTAMSCILKAPRERRPDSEIFVQEKS